MSESGRQDDIREHFTAAGWRLFRNNNGVLEDKRGVPVRFGLGNDSPAVNRVIKSGDLVGWYPRLVTPDMVGGVFAQFVSIEAKPPGWRFPAPTNKRAFEHCDAQRRWAQMVLAEGGIAGFMIDPTKGFEPCD